MITERVQYALTTSVGQVHIFIGESSPVLAWPKVQGGDRPTFIIHGQDPADHRLLIYVHTQAMSMHYHSFPSCNRFLSRFHKFPPPGAIKRISMVLVNCKRFSIPRLSHLLP